MSSINVDNYCKDCIKGSHCDGTYSWCFCCGEEEEKDFKPLKKEKRKKDNEWD